MSQQDRIDNLTLALAGLFQAASLVHDLAQHGHAEASAYGASINSVFKMDANSTADVFGGAVGVRYGLNQLRKFLDPSLGNLPPQLMHWILQLMQLEKRLRKTPDSETKLKERIEFAIKQAEFFTPLDATVINSLASIYADNISTLSPKIAVVGKEAYLTSNDIICKIRALLLAGIRSAVLWRQLGGRPWTLMLQRRKILLAIERWKKTF